MKKYVLLLGTFLGWMSVNAQNTGLSSSFDKGWLFTRDSVVHAELPEYNDASWKKVELPHDWSIKDLPNQTAENIIGPFDRSSRGQSATGFTVGGTGWYRKKFSLPKSIQSKIVTLYFDGVYMNADIWLNGHHLGSHPYGYTPFDFELTPYLAPGGQENVLAVRVRNEGKNSRWYSGSGIYRHVRLSIVNNIHIATDGVSITTPQVSAEKSTIKITSTIKNSYSSPIKFALLTTILSPEGKTVGRTQRILNCGAEASAIDSQMIALNHAALWSVETPRLYKAITIIKSGDKVVDQIATTFGIRKIHIDAQSGFTLNGKRVMLKGGCIHHDNGPLGSAAIDRAEERKIEILKNNGFNAIRLSHNPPSTTLLNVCDRLGMLVIDEAFDMWEKPKNKQDYHLYFREWWKKDLDAMLLRDRNHPSVIIWSIGNEIPERADSSGLRIARQLTERIHQLDPTRPTTQAICEFYGPEKDAKWISASKAFALLDIGGYNYLWKLYESDHRKFPDRVMMGTESFPKEALENWNMVEKHPYVIGDFVWTAVDYLGEASIGHNLLDTAKRRMLALGWPWFNAFCGDIDLIGQKKPQSYYRDVVWGRRPIAMAVHRPIPEGLMESVSDWGWPDEYQSWTWPEAAGQTLQVRVFSRAPRVRLKLNGKIIAEQVIPDTVITAVFQVPYQPGTLKAVNVVNGRETDETILQTVGKPQSIRLIADRRKIRANRNDLSYITAEVVDEHNHVVPNAAIPILFSVKGAGELAAVGNANPKVSQSFQGPVCKTFSGKCLAIIRPTGKSASITLMATADGIKSAQVVILSDGK